MTDTFKRLADASDSRIICLYGGSSSSKTISALQYLTMWGVQSEVPIVITVIGESVPVIKKSVFRDWQNIIMQGAFNGDRYNKMDNTYTFDNGSIMQFIPADDEQRFYAMRHDIVLFDEAYNISKGIFDQVEIRTRQQILLTWNPVAPFWATKLEDERNDVKVIHATYKDNKYVDPNIVEALEKRATIDPNFYRVFVLGQYGNVEGLIFKEGVNWNKVDEMPEDYSRRVFGVDFGFTYDPSAIVDVRYADGQFWIDEIEYKPGMFNRDIYNTLIMMTGKQTEVVADSAEPKSIAELRGMGLNMVSAKKGPDSVMFGIRTMQGFKLNVTKRSVNLIKELRNYSFIKNKDGEYIDRPVDNWDHCIDALRYVITHIREKPKFGQYAVS